MMLEIARFWASIARFDPDRGRYVIDGVMGPDEFHTKYPDAPSAPGGVNNNAYTNVMVAWIAETAITVLGLLPEARRNSVYRATHSRASSSAGKFLDMASLFEDCV